MSLKEQFQNEKAKLSKMNAKEKIDYIWEYYKYWIIGTIAGIALIYGIVSAQIENSKDTYLYLTMVNSSMVSGGETTLMDDFATYAQVDQSKVKLNLDTSIQMKTDMSDEYSMNSSAKMFAQFAAQTIDATIMNKDMIDFFLDKDAFADLEEILPAEFYKEHEDNFIKGTDSEGTEFICAIDLSDSKIFQKTDAYTETPYYSIIVNSENHENSIQFLEYLYSEN